MIDFPLIFKFERHRQQQKQLGGGPSEVGGNWKMRFVGDVRASSFKKILSE